MKHTPNTAAAEAWLLTTFRLSKAIAQEISTGGYALSTAAGRANLGQAARAMADQIARDALDAHARSGADRAAHKAAKQEAAS